MTIKRTLIKILPLLFLAFILIVGYSILNGIPFGKYIAKAKIKNYVKQVYLIDEVSLPKYNIEQGTYYATIQNNSKFEIIYDLSKNIISDERVQRAYKTQLDKEFFEMRGSYSGNIKLSFTTFGSKSVVANGNYSRDFNKLTCNEMMDFSIVNRQKIPPGDITKMPAIVTKGVLDKLSSPFSITSLRVIYTDSNGTFDIYINGRDKLTRDEIQKHTIKR